MSKRSNALRVFKKDIDKLWKRDKDRMFHHLSVETAKEVRRLAEENTPIHDPHNPPNMEKHNYYKNPDSIGKGGRLKKSWRTKATVKKGKGYFTEVHNIAEYASYVEHGHGQQVGWRPPPLKFKLVAEKVEGYHMLEKATAQVQDGQAELVRPIVKQYLEKRLNGKRRS